MVTSRMLTSLSAILVAAAFAGPAAAQAGRSALTDRADSMAQMGAASLVPTLRGRWLYADQGLAVGRVRDVRVAPDGQTLLAIVWRRRWLGGGTVAVPVPLLRQVGNDLTVTGSREAIRALPPL